MGCPVCIDELRHPRMVNGDALIKISLILQVFMNLMNIVLDLLFVHVFFWGVSGVAIATLMSEVTSFIIGLFIIIWKVSPYKLKFPSMKGIDFQSFKTTLTVNRDLFIRTICLLTVFNIFTAKGASFGTETLAANAVLIQIHFIMAYFFDGFANASSIFVGKSLGSKNEHLYKKTLLLSCQWAIISSVFIAGSYYLFSEYIISLFTHIPVVIDLANTYGTGLFCFLFQQVSVLFSTAYLQEQPRLLQFEIQ